MEYFHFSSDFYIYHQVFIGILIVFSQCIVVIILSINYIIHYSDIVYFIKLINTIIVILELSGQAGQALIEGSRQGSMIAMLCGFI